VIARRASRSESVAGARASQQAAFAGGAPRRVGERQYEPSVLGSFLSGGDRLEDRHGLSQRGRCLGAKCLAVARALDRVGRWRGEQFAHELGVVGAAGVPVAADGRERRTHAGATAGDDRHGREQGCPGDHRPLLCAEPLRAVHPEGFRDIRFVLLRPGAPPSRWAGSPGGGVRTVLVVAYQARAAALSRWRRSTPAAR